MDWKKCFNEKVEGMTTSALIDWYFQGVDDRVQRWLITEIFRRQAKEIEELRSQLKAFAKYAERYDRFFGSFDEPQYGTTLTSNEKE